MSLWRLQMMPLKMVRQRYVLINQVFSLSSVEVKSSQHLTRSPRGPSSLSSHTSSQDAGASLSDRMLWRQKAEDLLWLASAFFILYYGDFRSNFFSLLVNDSRIWRAPLHMGAACILSDIFILLYLAVRFQIKQEQLDLLIAASAIQAATIVGLAAFILLCIALWPIWTILTVPMLFTLFMASLVVLVAYLLPYTDMKMDQESLRYLCNRS